MTVTINTKQYNGDPNVLVHIAAFKIGTMTLPGVARIATGITTRNGITADEKVDLDTRRILEALASLSVCDERLQVVAVSMQIDAGEKSVTLSFAENGLVSPRIKPQITNLWNLLKEMSKHYAGEKEIDIKACQASFLGHVYPHSLPKIRKRFKSWMPLLKEFVEAAAKNDTNPPGDLLPGFQAIEKSLDLVHSILDKTSNQEALKKLIHEMDSVLEKWDSIRVECEEWLKKELIPFPIARALGKLASHHYYTQDLFSAAAAPYFQPLFLYNMTVHEVIHQPDLKIKIPGSEGEWKSIINSMFLLGDKKIKVADDLTNTQWALLSKSLHVSEDGTSVEITGAVHCECALVVYLQDSKPPAFNYIGVSKLSCGACHSWLVAYNMTYPENKYFTGGTHGKWYNPWVVPPIMPLKTRMSQAVRSEFLRYSDPSLNDVAREDVTGSTYAKRVLEVRGSIRGVRG